MLKFIENYILVIKSKLSLLGGSKGESVVTHLLSYKGLKKLVSLIYEAGINNVSDEPGPYHVLINTTLSSVLLHNLGAHRCTSLPSSSLDNMLPGLAKIVGTPSRLLEAYAAGAAPSAQLDAFLPGVLPLHWLALAQNSHRDFLRVLLHRQGGLVYPGHEHMALLPITCLPVCQDLLGLVETAIRLSQVSNSDDVNRHIYILLANSKLAYMPGVSLINF